MRSFWILLALVSLLATDRAGAAPFVPARDPQCVAYAPNGQIVATAVSGLSDDAFPPRPHPDVRKCAVIATWDLASGKRLRRWETFGDITKLAFSPDGSLLAISRLFYTGEGLALPEVRLWEVSTGKLVRTLERCHAFDFSPDGKSIVVLSRTKAAIYAMNNWEKETLLPNLGGGLAVSFSADGQAAIGIVKKDGKFLIRTCQLSDGKLLAESRSLDEPFYSLAISPEGGLIASGHAGGNVLVWEYPSLDIRTRLQTGTAGIAHPCYTPDGRFLAAITQDNSDVVFWEAAGAHEEQRFTFEKGNLKTHLFRTEGELLRPEKDPARLAFSPLGGDFMVGCYGGIIRRIEGGAEVRRFGD